MAIDDAQALARANRAYLIGPAGCGKTHLIARAVAHCKKDRELILTHTHAGVDALRRKLKYLGIPSDSYRVETIAGWALLYASSFPGTSGLITPRPTTKEQWDHVYKAAADLLRNSPARDIVRNSYSGCFVDEYQDCLVEQHDLVLELAKLLPCRILGDPLQGIFGFGKNNPVVWERDIIPNFQKLPELTFPWRWANTNPRLGSWLQEVRLSLLNGLPIDLQNAPIRWVQLPDKTQQVMTQLNICFKIANRTNGTVVAIHQWPYQCHQVASGLRGSFNVIEPFDCDELMKFGEIIHSTSEIQRAAAVIDFASCCMTKVKTEMKTIRQAFSKGRYPQLGRIKNKDQFEALMRVIEDPSLAPVLPALETLCQIPGAFIYRRELLKEMRGAIKEFIYGDYESLQEAAWHIRNRTSRIGRQLSRFTVGRTLLIKGLEFDHAIILDADMLDDRNLYVAMTRGTKSLTVCSKGPIVNPTKYETKMHTI